MLDITKNDRRLARDLIKCYSLIQFTSVGVPLVYYGDETCLEGGKDPDNRRTYPWGKEDIDMVKWFTELAAMRKSLTTLVTGDAEYFGDSDGNVFAMLRYSEDVSGGDAFYLTICDRFGRGREFLDTCIKNLSRNIEKIKEKSYIIVKEAGGYGLLVSFS